MKNFLVLLLAFVMLSLVACTCAPQRMPLSDRMPEGNAPEPAKVDDAPKNNRVANDEVVDDYPSTDDRPSDDSPPASSNSKTNTLYGTWDVGGAYWTFHEEEKDVTFIIGDGGSYVYAENQQILLLGGGGRSMAIGSWHGVDAFSIADGSGSFSRVERSELPAEARTLLGQTTLKETIGFSFAMPKGGNVIIGIWKTEDSDMDFWVFGEDGLFYMMEYYGGRWTAEAHYAYYYDEASQKVSLWVPCKIVWKSADEITMQMPEEKAESCYRVTGGKDAGKNEMKLYRWPDGF